MHSEQPQQKHICTCRIIHYIIHALLYIYILLSYHIILYYYIKIYCIQVDGLLLMPKTVGELEIIIPGKDKVNNVKPQTLVWNQPVVWFRILGQAWFWNRSAQSDRLPELAVDPGPRIPIHIDLHNLSPLPRSALSKANLTTYHIRKNRTTKHI